MEFNFAQVLEFGIRSCSRYNTKEFKRSSHCFRWKYPWVIEWKKGISFSTKDLATYIAVTKMNGEKTQWIEGKCSKVQLRTNVLMCNRHTEQIQMFPGIFAWAHFPGWWDDNYATWMLRNVDCMSLRWNYLVRRGTRRVWSKWELTVSFVSSFYAQWSVCTT